MDALDYDQTCFNASTKDRCKYLTQETSCIGPEPFKRQCQSGKYFNFKNNKCDMLIELDIKCSQTDSCKHGNWIGSPSKCQCLPFQNFDQTSGLCQDQLNFSSSTQVSSSSSTRTTSILLIIL